MRVGIYSLALPLHGLVREVVGQKLWTRTRTKRRRVVARVVKMPELTLLPLTVWELRCRGRLRAIALTPDALRKPRRGRSMILRHEEKVGAVRGEVHNWSAGSGFARRIKLHWVCPKCGKQEWGDLNADEPNPCLWFSGCPCVSKWLISYDADSPDFQATPSEPPSK